MLNAKSVAGTGVVIGAGTMGSGIAAQLANAGWQVWLLDVAGTDPNDMRTRNQAAVAGLERVRKNRPPLLALPEFAARVRVGNIEDDLSVLREADWIVEAVPEKRELKQAVMAQIAAHAGPDTVVSSNTSGLSLAEMTSHCSPEFRARFLGTHFLNPPRYLKLLEVVALPETRPEIAAGFAQFAERVLGHRVVFAKDTPGFISTRLWIAHLLDTIHTAVAHNLTVEEVDYLTGPLIGRPRSATFRMADLVGLDIIADIARNQYERLSQDDFCVVCPPGGDFLPAVIERLLGEGRLGDKSGAGFYKREGANLLALDLNTLEYRPRQEVRFEEFEALLRLPLPKRFRAMPEEDIRAMLPERFRTIGDATYEARLKKCFKFLYLILTCLRVYVEQVGPEIADDVLAIDRVMRWGFHWEIGPFEIQDLMFKPSPTAIPPTRRNYSGTGVHRKYRVFGKDKLQPMPVEPETISLADLKAAGKTVLDMEAASLLDLGDGVVCLEFHTKMNTFRSELTACIHAARERAEQEFTALVLCGQGPHFSAGYDLNLLLAAIEAGDWNTLDAMLQDVQSIFMGLKYAQVPVVAAAQGYTLGAGCECALHCAAIQAARELYMGFPERNAGVIPGGAGIKEMLARAMADWDGESDPFLRIAHVFDLMTARQNSTSAEEARATGLLRSMDGISRNADRLLYEAKERALGLANAGYLPPVKQSIRVLGEETLARLRLQIHDQYRAGALSVHDHLIADRIAFVLSGGNLPYAQDVSETYLLQLEREAFFTLAQEPKTVERMRHLLATGRPLKN
jgi:3-hydroxyacyl-CoA dehydrogenase